MVSFLFFFWMCVLCTAKQQLFIPWGCYRKNCGEVSGCWRVLYCLLYTCCDKAVITDSYVHPKGCPSWVLWSSCLLFNLLCSFSCDHLLSRQIRISGFCSWRGCCFLPFCFSVTPWQTHIHTEDTDMLTMTTYLRLRQDALLILAYLRGPWLHSVYWRS